MKDPAGSLESMNEPISVSTKSARSVRQNLIRDPIRRSDLIRRLGIRETAASAPSVSGEAAKSLRPFRARRKYEVRGG